MPNKSEIPLQAKSIFSKGKIPGWLFTVHYTVPYKMKWTLLALLFLYIDYPGDYPLTGRFRVHGWELSSGDRRAREKFLQELCGTRCPLGEFVATTGSSHTQNECNTNSWEEYKAFVKQIFARPDHRLTSSDHILQVVSPACTTDTLLPRAPFLTFWIWCWVTNAIGAELPGSHQQHHDGTQALQGWFPASSRDPFPSMW